MNGVHYKKQILNAKDAVTKGAGEKVI